MTASELHRQVALVALTVASRHGFALGGGNALIAHGIITRPTQDVDLFTNQEGGVEAAARAVEEALGAAGFTVQREDQAAELADIFPDIGQGMAEWTVISPAGERMVLQLAYFDRSSDPVPTDIGPMLALEDVAGGKVCALASRVEPRDYADTARMLERYSPAELINMARKLDPGLTARDFADAGLQLDKIADARFARYGLSSQEMAALRERFAGWPRTAEAVQRALAAAQRGQEPTRLAATDIAPIWEQAHPRPKDTGRDDPQPGG